MNIEILCLDSKFGELKFESSVNLLEKMRKDLIELEELDFRNKLSSSEIRDVQQAMEKFCR